MSNSNIKLQCVDDNDSIIFSIADDTGIVTNKNIVSTNDITIGNININGTIFLNNSDDAIYWKTQHNGISFTNGNVGIGITGPSYSLDVDGFIKSNSIYINSGNITQSLSNKVSTSFSTIGNLNNLIVPGFSNCKSFISHTLVETFGNGTNNNLQVILEGIYKENNEWELFYSVSGSDDIKNNILFTIDSAGVVKCTTSINDLTSISIGNLITLINNNIQLPTIKNFDLPIVGNNFSVDTDLYVNRNLYAKNDTYLNNIPNLGKPYLNPITVEIRGGLQLNNINLNGDIIPSVNESYDIGLTNKKIDNVYTGNFASDNLACNSINVGDIVLNKINVNGLTVANSLGSLLISTSNVFTQNFDSLNFMSTTGNIGSLNSGNYTTGQNLISSNISSSSTSSTFYTVGNLQLSNTMSVNNFSVGNLINNNINLNNLQNLNVSSGNMHVSGDILKNNQSYSLLSDWQKVIIDDTVSIDTSPLTLYVSSTIIDANFLNNVNIFRFTNLTDQYWTSTTFSSVQNGYLTYFGPPYDNVQITVTFITNSDRQYDISAATGGTLVSRPAGGGNNITMSFNTNLRSDNSYYIVHVGSNVTISDFLLSYSIIPSGNFPLTNLDNTILYTQGSVIIDTAIPKKLYYNNHLTYEKTEESNNVDIPESNSPENFPSTTSIAVINANIILYYNQFFVSTYLYFGYQNLNNNEWAVERLESDDSNSNQGLKYIGDDKQNVKMSISFNTNNSYPATFDFGKKRVTDSYRVNEFNADIIASATGTNNISMSFTTSLINNSQYYIRYNRTMNPNVSISNFLITYEYIKESDIGIIRNVVAYNYIGGIPGSSDFVYSSLSSALFSIKDGDKVRVFGNIVEPIVLDIDKNIEIYGGTIGSSISVLQNVETVLNITAYSVYIHDIEIKNTTQNGNDSFSCINSKTMNNSNTSGSSKIYIENCTITHPKNGIVINGDSYVIKNCIFKSNLNPGVTNTVYPIKLLGSTNNSLIEQNQFIINLDNTYVPIYCNIDNEINTDFYTGYTGNLTIKDNTFTSLNNNNVRRYIEFYNIFRNPGTLTNIGPRKQFSLFIINNNFSIKYAEYPILINYDNISQHDPFSFFNKIYLTDNTINESITEQKGLLYFLNSSNTNFEISRISDYYQNSNTITNININTTSSILLSEIPGLIVSSKQNVSFLNIPFVDLTLTFDKTILDTTSITSSNLIISGDIYKNNTLLKNSKWNQQNNDAINYTSGSVIIGKTSPQFMVSVSGITKSDDIITTGINNRLVFSQTRLGTNHSLGVDVYGFLWSWGRNNSGQLGTGNNIDKNSPTKIISQSKIIKISAGVEFSVALDDFNRVWTWGENNVGQLGDGTVVSKNIPINISDSPYNKFNNKQIIDIECGESHCIALDVDGNVWTWGGNSLGQLGDNTNSVFNNNPVQITSFVNKIVKIANITLSNHSSVIDNQGDLWSWGSNEYGQIGNGTAQNKIISPIKITNNNTFNGNKIVDVSLSVSHTLFIDTEEKLWSSGRNNSGQLGTGNNQNYLSPINIANTNFNNKGLVNIRCGVNYSMAIDQDGSLWVWGANEHGQLGDSTTASLNLPKNISVAPQNRFNGNPIVNVSCGFKNTFTIDKLNNLWSWGDNEYGQLGDNTVVSKIVPTIVKQLSDIIVISKNVGISNTSPNYKLDVNGDINASGIILSNGIVLTSDIRVKLNINDLSTEEVLEKILKLKVKKYKYKKEYINNCDDKELYGFIAQEVNSIIPSAIKIEDVKIFSNDKDTRVLNNFYYVNKDIINSYAIGAIQQLYKELQLKKEYHNNLKIEIQKIKTKLKNLV